MSLTRTYIEQNSDHFTSTPPTVPEWNARVFTRHNTSIEARDAGVLKVLAVPTFTITGGNTLNLFGVDCVVGGPRYVGNAGYYCGSLTPQMDPFYWQVNAAGALVLNASKQDGQVTLGTLKWNGSAISEATVTAIIGLQGVTGDLTGLTTDDLPEGISHFYFSDELSYAFLKAMLTVTGSATATWDDEALTLTINVTGGSGGAEAFTDLEDVPANYSGAGLKLVRVKTGADGLEFITANAALVGLGNVTNDAQVKKPGSATPGNLAVFGADPSIIEDGGAAPSGASITDGTNTLTPAGGDTDAFVITGENGSEALLELGIDADGGQNTPGRILLHSSLDGTDYPAELSMQGTNGLQLSDQLATVLLKEITRTFAGSGAPTTTMDTAHGYKIGDRYIDTTGDHTYTCADATNSAAVWPQEDGGGSISVKANGGTAITGITTLNVVDGTDTTVAVTDAGGGQANLTVNASGGGGSSVDVPMQSIPMQAANLGLTARTPWGPALSTGASTAPVCCLVLGDELWVGCYSSQDVKVFNLTTGEQIGSSISLSVSPKHMCATADYVYVTTGGTAVKKISRTSKTVSATITLSYNSYGCCWTGGNYVYIYTANYLVKVHVSTNAVTTFPGSVMYGTTTGQNLAWDGSNLWIADGPYIIKWDTGTDTASASNSLSDSMDSLAFDGMNILATASGAGHVKKINRDDATSITTISTGSSPAGICTDGKRAYVSNTGGNSITIVTPMANGSDWNYPTVPSVPGDPAMGSTFFYVPSGDAIWRFPAL